jgi:hypothetical protein
MRRSCHFGGLCARASSNDVLNAPKGCLSSPGRSNADKTVVKLPKKACSFISLSVPLPRSSNQAKCSRRPSGEHRPEISVNRYDIPLRRRHEFYASEGLTGYQLICRILRHEVNCNLMIILRHDVRRAIIGQFPFKLLSAGISRRSAVLRITD